MAAGAGSPSAAGSGWAGLNRGISATRGTPRTSSGSSRPRKRRRREASTKAASTPARRPRTAATARSGSAADQLGAVGRGLGRQIEVDAIAPAGRVHGDLVSFRGERVTPAAQRRLLLRQRLLIGSRRVSGQLSCHAGELPVDRLQLAVDLREQGRQVRAHRVVDCVLVGGLDRVHPGQGGCLLARRERDLHQIAAQRGPGNHRILGEVVRGQPQRRVLRRSHRGGGRGKLWRLQHRDLVARVPVGRLSGGCWQRPQRCGGHGAPSCPGRCRQRVGPRRRRRRCRRTRRRRREREADIAMRRRRRWARRRIWWSPNVF